MSFFLDRTKPHARTKITAYTFLPQFLLCMLWSYNIEKRLNIYIKKMDVN